MKCGELRWSDRDGDWEVLIPSVAFKNASSSFFGQKPFRLSFQTCWTYTNTLRLTSTSIAVCCSEVQRILAPSSLRR